MEENIDTEIWRKVEGYDNYSVSNQGRVKNKDDYIMTGGINSKTGYRYVILGNNKKNLKIHRLVALAFIPNPNNLPQVNHIDKNRLNNNINNLEWVYNIDNNQSVNKNVNIGCIFQRPSGDWQSRFTYYKKNYQFSNPNEDKCQDWLNARRIELENNLQLTELDLSKKVRKKGTGSIYSKNNRFVADIKINGSRNCKPFDSYEEANDYIENLLKS